MIRTALRFTIENPTPPKALLQAIITIKGKHASWGAKILTFYIIHHGCAVCHSKNRVQMNSYIGRHCIQCKALLWSSIWYLMHTTVPMAVSIWLGRAAILGSNLCAFVLPHNEGDIYFLFCSLTLNWDGMSFRALDCTYTRMHSIVINMTVIQSSR